MPTFPAVEIAKLPVQPIVQVLAAGGAGKVVEVVVPVISSALLAATAAAAAQAIAAAIDELGIADVAGLPTALAALQPRDATLTALAEVTVGADRLVYATGPDAFATSGLTAAGRALIDDASVPAQRATLGLGSAAVLAAAVAGGAATLDASTGKLVAAQIPDVLLGAVRYQGGWNASSNVPALPTPSAANKGFYWIVLTAGTTSLTGPAGAIAEWQVGDWAISDGTSWEKIDSSDQVVSVAGLQGVITAAALKTALAIAIGNVGGLQAALDSKLDDVQASIFGLSLIDDVDAAGARSTLALGALSTKSSAATSDLDNDGVTNAKLANVASATFKGRSTAGVGDPEDLSVAQTKTLLGFTAFGGSLAGAADAPAALALLGTDAIYARGRNRVCDPGQVISQQRGGASVSLASSGTVYYPCDSVYAVRAGAAGAASAQRIASATPGGSRFRTRVTVTSANASPASSDHLLVGTALEGYDVADLLFGTAAARPITRRIGVNSSVAGTFPVSVRGGGRSWLGSITIAAGDVGVDVVRFLPIPGDTSGVWETGAGLGLQLDITLCAGSNLQGAVGWQANAGLIGLAGSTNLMATAGATFDLFDLGLYQGQVAPPFEVPPYEQVLRKCQRYYAKTYRQGDLPGALITDGALYRALDGTTAYASLQCELPVEQRQAGAWTVYSPGTGAPGNVYNPNSSTDAPVLPPAYVGPKRGSIIVNNTTVYAGNAIAAHVVSDARMV